MRKLQLIESRRYTGARNRRNSGVDRFDVFIADDKYEISIIDFIDLLIKYSEDKIIAQRPQLQRFQAWN